MNRTLEGFDWDDGNRAKCTKHGVTVAEIEALFSRSIMVLPDADHSVTEQRFKAIGRTTAGRYVFIVFTLREKDGRFLVRPISARYMHRKEVNSYEKANPDLQE